MEKSILKLIGIVVLGINLTACSSMLDLLEMSEEETDLEYSDTYTSNDYYENEDNQVNLKNRPLERKLSEAIQANDVILGMTRSQVEKVWGEPSVREFAGTGAMGHERWTYKTRYSLGKERVIIFENGKVAGWRR